MQKRPLTRGTHRPGHAPAIGDGRPSVNGPPVSPWYAPQPEATFVRFVDARDDWRPAGLSGNLGRAVLLNLALTAVGLVAAGLVPFGFNLSVGHQFGAATLGRIAVALNLALFLGQIPGTLGGAAAKFIAESLGAGEEQEGRSIFAWLFVLTLVVGCVLGAGVLVVGLSLMPVLHWPAETAGLTAALVPAYALYIFLKSAYYGFDRVRRYLINEIISDAAFFALLVTLLIGGVTSWLLLPFVVNNLGFAVIALWDLRLAGVGKKGARLSGSRRREVIEYCLVNGGGTVASLGRWSLGVIVAGWFLGAHSVGLFAAAVALTAPLALLPRAISLVTFAAMARLHGAGESLSVRTMLSQSTEWLVLLLGIPSGLAILNAGGLLSIAFRPEFATAATAAQLIIAGAYITDISRPSIDALSSTTHVRIATVASVAGLLVSLAVWLALIPAYGITMAGLGFALGAAVTALIPALAAVRLIGSKAAVFIRPAGMLAALWLLTLTGPGLALPASLAFVAGVCLLYRHLGWQLVREARRVWPGRPGLRSAS